MRIFGFGFHERELRPASEDLAREWLPYAETSVEAFGADRCMFESNFPWIRRLTAMPSCGMPLKA
jgi:L-fuconolactonase